MTSYARIIAAVVALGALELMTIEPAAAQEKIGGGGPEERYRAGWTLTPTVGFAGVYDDNVTLFGAGTADNANNDFVSMLFPELDLHYAGKHTQFGTGYSSSYLDYRTFQSLNRWAQGGRLELRREESARVKWFAHGSAASMPSTDLVDLGGIPFHHVGVDTALGRGGVEYKLATHDSLSQTYDYQSVSFDRPEDLRTVLRGGHVQQTVTTYRRHLDPRLTLGADYSFRHSAVLGEPERFNIHQTLALADYELSPAWTIRGGAGVVYLMSTATTGSQTGPAYRASIERHRDRSDFHAGYLRSYLPSFGFGGTVENQEVSVGYRTPIFGSRCFYTEQAATFRDDRPLTNLIDQLPLRSLRTTPKCAACAGP